MKTYVLGYKSKESAVELSLQYGARPLPDSKYATRTLAEADCRNLNQSGVHVGSHHCSFTVDALPEGEFGIFCVCHPF